MSQIDWSKLIRLDYWFEGVAGNTSITPPLEIYSFHYWFFLWFYSIVFSLGVVIKVIISYMHIENPVRLKLDLLGNNFIWVGIVGSSWFILRQIRIGFLGARFWNLLIIIWIAGLSIYLIRYYILYFKFEYLYFKNKTLVDSQKFV